MTTVIQNARIFDGIRFIPEDAVLIRSGRVASIHTTAAARGMAGKKVDLKGMILSPGFIDIHAHGALGIDVQHAGSVRDLHRVSSYYLTTGVTSFVFACFYEDGSGVLKLIKKAASAGGRAGARVLGAYLEGPCISLQKKGMIPANFINHDIKPVLKMLHANRVVRLMTVAPEVEGAMRVVRECNRLGVVPCFGHSAAGYEEVRSAIRGGIRSVTHLFNAMAGMHHREPGPFAAITESGIFAELIADGVHVHPSMLKMAFDLIGPQRAILVTDSCAAAGCRGSAADTGFGRYRLRGGAAYLPDGTLAGSTTPLAQMVRNTVRWCGLTREQALRTVTYNPAALLGLDGLGVIRPGAKAEFNVLDRGLCLKKTMIL